MTFASYNFLFLFLPAAVLLYTVFRTSSYRNVVLVLLSYTFYAWGQGWLVILLILCSVVDYGMSHVVARAATNRTRNFALMCSLVLNLGLLAALKYAGWLAGGINQAAPLLGLTITLPGVDIPLPPGISFYTFQNISYIVDVYRRKLSPERRFIDYASSVAFFPLLVAGPIERPARLLPQIRRVRARPGWRKIESALFMIVIGLVKKLVFADNLAHMVQLSYQRISIPGAGWILMYAFGFQIYMDFSAYTDIARGTARLFNVHLSRNFRTPYFSTSPSEFWRRWHISLSTWIRDYVYIPLGGSRSTAVMVALVTLATMLLGGLWHGAGLFFILWGGYHGLLLVLYRLVPLHKLLPLLLGRVIGTAAAIAILFHLVFFGWVLFWADATTFPRIFESMAQLVRLGGVVPAEQRLDMWMLAYGLLIFATPPMVIDYLAWRRGRDFAELGVVLSPVPKAALYLAGYFLIVFFAARSSYAFIYFQF